jgi:energy-converting hydrogenase Eha subunit C
MPSEDCEKGGTSAAPQRSATADVNAPALSIADAKNVGADVTLSQQARILCSASLAAFTVVGMYAFLGSVDHPGFWVFVLIRTGLTQAFGVFQAHYGRPEAAREGVSRPEEQRSHALISAIGSLGNGGIVAVFAVLYYPHLPQLGMHVKTLCSIGTVCMVLGYATAISSRNVSQRNSLIP